MEFLALERNHIEQVVEIEKETFSMPYNYKMMIEMLESQNYHYIIAVDQIVLGYIGINVVFDECDITHIAVKEQFRGNKIADKLMQKLCEHCNDNNISKVFLEVRESNFKAINLYKKHSFVASGVRKNYYKDPQENAIIMIKEV